MRSGSLSIRAMTLICAASAFALTGCQSPPANPPPAAAAVPPADASASDPMPDAPSEPIHAIDRIRVRQEILLHAALYRAALQSSVGTTGRFILEPMQEDHPPDLGVPAAEFRQAVVDELAGLGVPIAWAPSTWRTQVEDLFPGTGEKASRLAIRVFRRDDDHATVLGEISDRTQGERSSRQGVTATWDGENWVVDRDPVRVVW